MHYYRFNIKTYQAATAHLKPLEDLAYRRLIDYYMDTEKPIDADLSRLARRLRTTVKTIDLILEEFFFLQSDGWHNEFCDAEIASYRAQAEKNKKNGQKGGRPRKASEALQTLENENPVGYEWDATGNPNESQKNPNKEPRTKNQEQTTNKNTTPRKRDESVSVDYLISVGCDGQAAKDWLAIRKTKKLPLTQTALKTIQSEADKAGVTLANAIEIAASNSWAGFKASWLQNLAAQEAKQPESFIDLHTDRSWAGGMTSSFMSGQRIDAQRLLAHD
jgi:uncharacterized protein YdaU (DUF1376 family)